MLKGGVGMVDSGEALKAVSVSGYTQGKVIREHRLFVSLEGCSKSDSAGFEVDALNMQGKPVRLLVCVGWPLKSATVRIP